MGAEKVVVVLAPVRATVWVELFGAAAEEDVGSCPVGPGVICCDAVQEGVDYLTVLVSVSGMSC